MTSLNLRGLLSSHDKVSVNFEWSISKDICSISLTLSSSPKQNSSPAGLNSPKTPYKPTRNQNFDSGYNSTVGCHVPNIQNWRQNTTPLPQPKFVSPANKIKHDVFVNPKSSTDGVSNVKSPSSSKNSKLSTSLQLIPNLP